MTDTKTVRLNVPDAITRGTYDDQLDQITEVCRARQQFLAKVAASDLQPGDRFLLSDQARPKYLVGQVIEVTKAATGNRRLVGKLVDGGVGRFHGDEIRIPAGLIGERV